MGKWQLSPEYTLEAMAVGKPIITTKMGEIPNIVKDRKEVLLVDPTKEKIAEAIEQILVNKNLTMSLAHNTNILVNQKYS